MIKFNGNSSGVCNAIIVSDTNSYKYFFFSNYAKLEKILEKILEKNNMSIYYKQEKVATSLSLLYLIIGYSLFDIGCSMYGKA